VAETTAKRLLCCGFRCTVKAMGQESVSMLVQDMSRNKCFFLGSNIMFYVLYPFMTYLLTLPHNMVSSSEAVLASSLAIQWCCMNSEAGRTGLWMLSRGPDK
jgi:hypothetical protein